MKSRRGATVDEAEGSPDPKRHRAVEESSAPASASLAPADNPLQNIANYEDNDYDEVQRRNETKNGHIEVQVEKEDEKHDGRVEGKQSFYDSDSEDDATAGNNQGRRRMVEIRRDCPYLDTVNRQALDFDFERFCSVSLSNLNVYACLVCGKYYQGRGKKSHAYTHSLEAGHHIYINLQTEKVYCLPDGYEINDPSLDDIRHVLNPRFTKEQVATGGMAISSSRPPTPIELDAMEQTYMVNQSNRRAGKQSAVDTRESTGSSDSSPSAAPLTTSQPRGKRLNRRRKSSDIRCDSIIGDALDMIRDYTDSLSPSATGTTKRSESVSSPPKSESQACMDLAKEMRVHLTTDEYVDLTLLLKDDWHRTVFMNLIVLDDIEFAKLWISKAKNS